MGHASTLLNRIDPAAAALANRALTLYRDPEFVRSLLADARVESGDGHIAIALDNRARPATAVVARDGAFISCRPPQKPEPRVATVGAEELDRLGQGFEAIKPQTRPEQADGLPADSHLSELLGALIDAMHATDRETVTQLAAVSPVMGRGWLDVLATADQWMVDATGAWLRGTREAGPEQSEQLKTVWMASHLAGHALALLGGAAAEATEQRAAVIGALGERLALAAGHGARFPLTTSVWLAGRLGRTALGTLAEWLAGSTNTYLSLATLMGIGAIGLSRSDSGSGARAEAVEATRAVDGAADDSGPSVEAEVAAWMREELLAPGFETPSSPELLGPFAFDSRLMAARVGLLHDLPMPSAAGGDRRRFLLDPTWEQEPAAGTLQFGKAMVLRDRRAWFAQSVDKEVSHGGLDTLLDSLPFLATAKLEELYLPEAQCDAMERWKPAWSVELLTGSAPKAASRRAAAPAKSTGKPGRNAPCPCGSGKKFKRCCG